MATAPDDPSRPSDDGVARRQQRNAEAAGSVVTGEPAEGDGLTDEEIAEARQARVSARRAAAKKSSRRNLIEWVAVIAGAIVIAVVVRTFVFQTFWIPSPSMSTTLVKDDRVLVNKLSYRFHDVNRGDVVVFERPDNMPESNIKDLIKRVVALPGERVSIIDQKVRIDGRALDEPYTNGLPTEPRVACAQPADLTGIDTEAGYEIPEGHVLVLGDNRTDSTDGRCFGPIDEDLIVGRAFVIMWPPGKIGGL